MKRNTRKHKHYGIIFLVFFICIFIIIYYIFIALPIIKVYSSIETKAITEKAINLAVSNVINRTLSYDSLIDINYDSNGEIVSFSANQYEINTITREIVKEAQYEMNHLGEDGLFLNLGTLSGFPPFFGRGPKINLRLIPIGAVSGEFSSEFNSVGINMTKHTLFLAINVHVSIVLPIKAHDVYATNHVLLAESVILGKVPQVYLNGQSLGKSLNLVP